MSQSPETVLLSSKRISRWAGLAAVCSVVVLISGIVGHAPRFALVAYSVGVLVACGNAVVQYRAARRATSLRPADER